ncbi:hypothetical protein HaLaN_19800, partial [Haematococcus lacustris]
MPESIPLAGPSLMLSQHGRSTAGPQLPDWLPMPMQDLESITVAELMYHEAVATGKGRLLLFASMWRRSCPLLMPPLLPGAEPDLQSDTLCANDEHYEKCVGSLLLKRQRLEGQAAPRVQAGQEQEAAAADLQAEVDACEELLAAILPPRVDCGGAWLPAQLIDSQQAVADLVQQVTHAMAAQQSQAHSVDAALPPWSWPPTTLAL